MDKRSQLDAYPTYPWAVRSPFLKHVAATAHPETFPTICTSTPPRDARVEIVAEFTADRSKRPDSQPVPCPICSPNAPKYLEGRLAWFPDEGVIRAIGHECGDKYFDGVTFRRAVAASRHRDALLAAEEYLEHHLHYVRRWSAVCDALDPACREAQRLHDRFIKDAPRLYHHLSEIKRSGGLLAVTVEVRRASGEGPRGLRTSGGSIDVREEDFGILTGDSMLTRSFAPLRKLIGIRTSLTEIDVGEDRTAAFDWICDNSASLDRLTHAVKVIQKAQADYAELRHRLDSIAAFFTPENFQRLNASGGHPHTPLRLRASVRQGIFTIDVAGHDAERILLTPKFDLLAQKPEWPMPQGREGR